MAIDKAKHAFGMLEKVDSAISDGIIDAYDILFLKDANGKPYVGWIDKQGQKVIVNEEDEVVFVKDETLPVSGQEGKIYIFKGQAYIWNGTEFTNLCKPTDLTKLEAKIESLENMQDDVNYIVSHKPAGTIVDYRDKEIRIMCPANTQWSLQQSGEGADPNSYYIGFKAYAPSADVTGFKEALAKTITGDDDVLYDFNGDFAGTDPDGRNYSIVWLPAAKYDETTSTWTYYGAKSTEDKFVGWYYSVEWYDANGVIVASDCIKINLSNEGCHAIIEPFYIAEKIAEVAGAIEVVEF